MKKMSLYLGAFAVFILVTFGLISIGRSQRENGNKPSPTTSQIDPASTKIQSESGVRKLAVAGSFYPSDKEELKTKIDELLGQSPSLNYKDKIRILIVPHAGLEYSGLVSAYGFNQLKQMNYSRVILLGSSHTTAYDYLALDDSEFWETPLGKVEVDRDFVETLVNGRSIKIDKIPHMKEHSLEMELIFLLRVLSDFKIVPILAGQIDEGHINMLAQKLAYNFDDETLLVVSSDLSHYPNWETANIVDKQIIESIIKGDTQSFEKALSDIRSKNYQNLETAACAQDAIKVALQMAEIMNISRFDRLKYQNSGDVTGEKNRVVGYSSIVGSSLGLSDYSLNISDEAKEEMLKIARNTIESYLTTKKIPSLDLHDEALEIPLGVFVTLTENGELRGCIGEFEPTRPLYEIIRDTAIKSATKDTRFKPVTADELSDIEIEISVMTPRRKLGNWQEIRIGVDGVAIQKGVNSGTFLPQVATDNNWGLEEFLSQLCTQKARLTSDCYKDTAVNIYGFEVLSFKE